MIGVVLTLLIASVTGWVFYRGVTDDDPIA